MYTDNACENPYTYTGEFRDGLYHGEGKLTEGGRTFEGTFRENRFHDGRLIFGNHQTYEYYYGGCLKRKLHGQGTLHFRNGNVYIGGFEND